MDKPVVAGDEKTSRVEYDEKLSMLKASKHSTTWWLPTLEVAIHVEPSEIRIRLE